MGGNPTVCKGFYIYMGMFVNTRGKLQRHLDLGLEINTLGQGCIVREIDWIISLRGMHCGKHEEKAHTGAGAPSHVLLPRITTRLPSPSSFYNKEAHSSSGGIK
jgi:hypothetical protein